MKKLYLLPCLIFISIITKAQFVDSFESYTVGSYLGVSSPNWIPWSMIPGGPDDVKITNSDAHSGTQSVYFQSVSSAGGPEDMVLLFDSMYTSGNLKVDMWLRVEAGKGAYFNFQGDPTIGVTWSSNVFFVQTGVLLVQDNNSITTLSTTYPVDTWFKLTFDIDFQTNNWKVLVDDVMKGSWANPINRAASIDFFPYNSTAVGGNNLSGFYLDDISLTFTPFVLPARDGAIKSLGFTGKFTGQDGYPYFTIENIGTDTLKSFDILIDYNNTQVSQSFTSNIPYQATADFVFPVAFTAVNDTITAIISNVNGIPIDMNPADDTMRFVVDQLITPQPNKRVIAEMVTGTSYGWAPKGIVYLADMVGKYPDYFIPINIHYSDPMENSIYYQGISNSITQFPSALVNRTGLANDPSFIEDEFLTHITLAPTALLTNTSNFIDNRSNLKVDVSVDFISATSGNYGLVVVITEDGVTGTTPDYGQLNNYSHEAFNIPWSGAGINWQLEPDTVPASTMVYEHVARYISPDFAGKTNIFPSSINTGDTFNVSFTIEIDSTLGLSNFNVISILLRPDGTVDNATISDLSNAQVIITNTGIQRIKDPFGIQLFPNPALDKATIRLDLHEKAIIHYSLVDIAGKSIFKESKELEQGNNEITLNLQDLSEGIYFVKIQAGEKQVVKKLLITK